MGEADEKPECFMDFESFKSLKPYALPKGFIIAIQVITVHSWCAPCALCVCSLTIRSEEIRQQECSL